MKKVREGYKMTELGEIPEEWEVKKLGEVSRKIGDGLHGTPSYVENGDYYFINGNNLINGKIVITKDTKRVREDDYYNNDKKLDNNSILMSLNGTIGNLAYYNYEKVMLGKSAGYITLNDNINKKFIFYLLSTEKTYRYFLKELTGTTIKNLSLESIRKTPLCIPSKKEQEKIALILSTVDEQIDIVDGLIQKNKELKKALMQQLLTKGIGHTKFKKSEVGEIPEEWEVKKLKNIAEICYGKSQKEVEVDEGRYKILGTGGIIGFTNDYLWDKPSVLIGRKGTIDKPQYIEEPFWTVDTLFYTKLKDKNLAKWFYYYMDNLDLKKYNEATGVPSLNTANLNTIKIATPAIQEQEKIASILFSVDLKIDEYEAKKQKLEELKKGLMQQLLLGNIRVFKL